MSIELDNYTLYREKWGGDGSRVRAHAIERKLEREGRNNEWDDVWLGYEIGIRQCNSYFYLINLKTNEHAYLTVLLIP